MARLIFRQGHMDAELASRLHARPRLLVFDFDGTLAPIALTPEEAELSPRLQNLLKALAKDPKTRLAFVSGRALPELRLKIGLKRVVYVGNHGLTSDLPGIGGERIDLQRWQAAAQTAYDNFKPLVERFAGVRLEFKGPDLSIHYRQVAPRQEEMFLRAAKQAVRKLPLVARFGKKVLELRPRTRRNKGSALRRLSEGLAAGWRRQGVCLYLGDDQTDEDAFGALKHMGSRAVGIKVGWGVTRAQYRLRDTEEVGNLLWVMLTDGEGRTCRPINEGG